MAPAVFLTTRNFAVLKQFQHVLKVKNRAPFRSLSQCMYKPTTRFPSMFPTCGCGTPVGTVSRISHSATIYSNKTVGMEYEDGKLIYFGAKAPLVKGVQMTLYLIGAAIALPSPYLWSIIEQEFAFSHRYVIELYHDKENGRYTAVVPSILVFGQRKITFTAKDCSMPDSPSAFASFLVHKTPLLVSSDNMDYFEYSKMLRYTTDLDYENPDRQNQYEETLQDAIREIGSQKPKRQSPE